MLNYTTKAEVLLLQAAVIGSPYYTRSYLNIFVLDQIESNLSVLILFQLFAYNSTFFFTETDTV